MFLEALKYLFVFLSPLIALQYFVSLCRGRLDASRGIALIFAFIYAVTAFKVFGSARDARFYFYGVVVILLLGQIGSPPTSRIRILVAPILIHVLSLLNIGIMIFEMAASQINENTVRVLQEFLVDQDTVSTILLHRKMFGITFVRPMGLLGQIQTSALFAAMYLLWVISVANVSRVILLLCIILSFAFLAATGGTQAVLSFAIGSTVLAWLTSTGRQRKLIYPAVLVGTICFFLILNSVGHLSTTRHDSMLRIYIEGFDFLQSDKLPHCLVTGCFWYINDTYDWFLPTFGKEIASGKFSSFLMDNGLINLLFCLGLVFLVLMALQIVFNAFIIRRQNRMGNLTRYSISLMAIYASAFVSLIHMPVMLSSVGLTLMISFGLVCGLKEKNTGLY